MARAGVRAGLAACALLVLLAGCDSPWSDDDDRIETARDFPPADRPVAPVGATKWSTEEARDRVNEAEDIMDSSGVRPGMTVADIGAGDGYYTVRLAARVGAGGRVLAQDIQPEVIERLADRVARERLDNVSLKLGAVDDPRLPQNSFDRVFMVHMYHEIGEPYAFLWRLRPALRQGGQVIVVDGDRPIEKHGTPFRLLVCEFEAVGYKLLSYDDKQTAGGYLARFVPAGQRPEPGAIKVCENP
ncbi:class I SAM-dependent methyltransferase [Sphingopyxis indica]|uniref:Methyltransferase domain-containing protein n=1 Tax=Sphingopyxis indica TaxID=436663 RepID=A0A239HXX1_9SPHN|nr:class I SAM-dependent methyltransferase [Sphingopyxis indica]SNS86260.1 Methyltransferase domain-containing protein [Sphingopyxis indica]